jgi:hypothetical protein
MTGCSVDGESLDEVLQLADVAGQSYSRRKSSV